MLKEDETTFENLAFLLLKISHEFKLKDAHKDPKIAKDIFASADSKVLTSKHKEYINKEIDEESKKEKPEYKQLMRKVTNYIFINPSKTANNKKVSKEELKYSSFEQIYEEIWSNFGGNKPKNSKPEQFSCFYLSCELDPKVKDEKKASDFTQLFKKVGLDKEITIKFETIIKENIINDKSLIAMMKILLNKVFTTKSKAFEKRLQDDELKDKTDSLLYWEIWKNTGGNKKEDPISKKDEKKNASPSISKKEEKKIESPSSAKLPVFDMISNPEPPSKKRKIDEIQTSNVAREIPNVHPMFWNSLSPEQQKLFILVEQQKEGLMKKHYLTVIRASTDSIDNENLKLELEIQKLGQVLKK
jgi:hypothetical protein